MLVTVNEVVKVTTMIGDWGWQHPVAVVDNWGDNGDGRQQSMLDRWQSVMVGHCGDRWPPAAAIGD